MIYRSKAPLRIGLAGGGTDVSPYSDLYGGAILNATVSLYAHATIEPLTGNTIILQGLDRGEEQVFDFGNGQPPHFSVAAGPGASQPANPGQSSAPLAPPGAGAGQSVNPGQPTSDSQPGLPIDGKLDLLKGVYNRICKEYGGASSSFPKGFRLSTFVDAPAGSGLGTSSTLVVAIIGAFAEMLRLPLGEYDMAHLAYDIERVDLQMAGGKQDQYAATFGGVNYMEFYGGDKVIVNPLRIKQQYLFELENNLLLYYTSTSRESARIIEKQSQNVVNKQEKSIEAMHQLKHQAQLMKEAILKGRVHEIGEILDFGFRQKQQMAEGISNSLIDGIYEAAKKAGATGGKISGAGGGGFMTFYCPGIAKYRVMEELATFGGYCKPYQFTDHGQTSWTI